MGLAPASREGATRTVFSARPRRVFYLCEERPNVSGRSLPSLSRARCRSWRRALSGFRARPRRVGSRPRPRRPAARGPRAARKRDRSSRRRVRRRVRQRKEPPRALSTRAAATTTPRATLPRGAHRRGRRRARGRRRRGVRGGRTPRASRPSSSPRGRPRRLVLPLGRPPRRARVAAGRLPPAHGTRPRPRAPLRLRPRRVLRLEPARAVAPLPRVRVLRRRRPRGGGGEGRRARRPRNRDARRAREVVRVEGSGEGRRARGAEARDARGRQGERETKGERAAACVGERVTRDDVYEETTFTKRPEDAEDVPRSFYVRT